MFTDEMTVREARDLLRDLVDEGHSCPVCRQFAKVYRRSITGSMAAALVTFYRKVGTMRWAAAPVVLKARREWAGGDWGKLRYWGLVEEETDIRRDDGGRAGYWRVTIKGEQFIREQITVPRHALVYDGRCLSLEGEPVTIRQRLGKKFRLDDLMAGTA